MSPFRKISVSRPPAVIISTQQSTYQLQNPIMSSWLLRCTIINQNTVWVMTNRYNALAASDVQGLDFLQASLALVIYRQHQASHLLLTSFWGGPSLWWARSTYFLDDLAELCKEGKAHKDSSFCGLLVHDCLSRTRSTYCPSCGESNNRFTSS